MTALEQQAELALLRRVESVRIPIEMVRSKRSAGAAFTLACDASNLEDKEIYSAFEPPIDAGTFSRIKKGTNTLDADRVAEFCRIVKNTYYPEWMAYQVGCTLVMMQTEAERRAEIAEKENRMLRELLMGRMGAAA